MTGKRWLVFAVLCMPLLAGCGGGSEGDVVRGDVGVALDEYLTRITPFGFSGAVLVATDGEIVLSKGYGLASVSEGVPNTPGTIFTTASITKQFTAAAIVKLEMDERLRTEDLLSAHIEGVPNDKAGITLHHLLTHTAGVVGSTGDDYEEVGRDEVVRRVLEAPLAFEPGTAMSYSNAGYSLLAAVVEVASERSFEDFLNERLFAPAGMHRTGYWQPRWRRETVAHWYDGATDNGIPLDRPFPHWNLLGNGGILSTTGDMFLWYEALKGEDVLSAASREKLLTPFLDDYAYGWDVRDTERGKLVQHDGANMLGASAELRWFVDADVAIILFCNRSFAGTPLFSVVRDEIETIVFGGEVDVPPAQFRVDGENLEEFAADYLLPSGGRYRLSEEDGTLRISTFHQDAINALFVPDEGDSLLYKDLNLRSGRLVAAAVSGNSEFFSKDLGDEQAGALAERALTGLVDRFARMTGAGARVAVALGTVPIAHDGMVLTSVRLRNELGSIDDIGFLWREGHLVGIDETGYEVSFPIVRVSESEFAGYHLGFAKVIPLKFEAGGDDEEDALILKHRRARRFKPHVHDHGDEGHE